MSTAPAAHAFEVAVGRLINRVAHWTPPRWAASSASGPGTRADVVYALVQRIADACTDAEGRPRRPVPRLDSDLALPDQLRVVSADLVAAAPGDAVLRAAADAVRACDP